MIRLLVLGGTGMLGHKLCQVASERHETWATIRGVEPDPAAAEVLDPDRVIPSVSAEDQDAVVAAIEQTDAEVVINCIGIVKQSSAASDPVAAIRVNSLFPHEVAAACRERGRRFVHISTDCVFSGDRGNYVEDDVPDARDLYGRSKLLGEAAGDGSVTLRTSIIGRELAGSYGLVEWFLGERGNTVRGFSRAIFSGLSTAALARVILTVIDEQPQLEGLWHVSAEPIAKDRLLRIIRDAFDLDVEIEASDAVKIDRSLNSTRFRRATDWIPPGWEQMVAEMAADSTPYEKIRRSTLA